VGKQELRSKICSAHADCMARCMRPAQLEALAGTGLLVFSAFRRGPLGLVAFLGATALIVHASVSRAAQGFR